MKKTAHLLVFLLPAYLFFGCAVPEWRPVEPDPASAPAEVEQSPETVTSSGVEPRPTPLPDSEAIQTEELAEPAGKPVEETTLKEPASESEPDEGITLYEITGSVEIVSGEGTSNTEQVRDVVVYFVPEVRVESPEPGFYEIRTERKRFIPDVLVIPVGSTVAFPNDDDILHNVFSVSSSARFDLGRYGLGESQSYTFNETGLALIHCDVHHAMQADVLVVDTPYYTTANDDGAFSLSDVPAGPGTLHIWHPRTEQVMRSITLPLGEAVNVSMDVVKPRVARHARKTGGSYRQEQTGKTPLPDYQGTDPAKDDGVAVSEPSSALPVPEGDNVIEGSVELVAEDEAPDPEQLRDIVVYYEPSGGLPRPLPADYRIGTRNKTFDPDVLVVPVGSTVAFPNDDDLLHNVFSVSPNAVFDLGRYGLGESRSYTFEEPGLALIHCDVHHHMQADVLVLETPYYTSADGEGWFRLANLPDGSGNLHIWHPRADVTTEHVTLPSSTMVSSQLKVTKPRVPKHLNKFGEPYRDPRRRERQYE